MTPFAAAEWPQLVSGGLLHPVRFALAALWCYAWLRLAAWVSRDAVRSKAPHGIWRAGIVLAGLASMLPLASVPWWTVAAPLALALVAAPTLGYVFGGRNPYLPPERRLLSGTHLASLKRRALRSVGIATAETDAAVEVVLPKNLRNDAEAQRRAVLLAEFLEAAFAARAAEAALEIGRGTAAHRFRIDGVWSGAVAADPEAALRMHEFLAGAAADQRRLKRVAFDARRHGEPFVVRALASGSANRLRASFQLPDGPPPRVEALGFAERDAALAAAAQRTNGLVLACGPAHSGRRTTLRALAAAAGKRKVVALDEPGSSFMIPGAEAAPLDAARADGFLEALRLAAAGAAQTLVVGRVPDAPSALALLEAAKSKLVLAAFEAENPVLAALKLAAWSSRDAVAERLALAFGQRLPRRLCMECREGYRPDPDALRRANVPAHEGERYFRRPPPAPRPCRACLGVGHVGCVGIFETLAWTHAAKAAFLAGAGERELFRLARADGMETLAEAAFRLLAAGTTSAEELRRAWQAARATEAAA